MRPLENERFSTPKYGTIPTWCKTSGMSRSSTYLELGRGNLRAVKFGKRTLIDMDAGFGWMATLPAAQIRAPKVPV
jgi:hypothetical protein